MKFRTMIEHRKQRLMFVRFLHKTYGLNIQTAYAKLRECRFKKWECIGISACIREYAPSYRGKKKEFYQKLYKKKLDFSYFMESMGMCERTARKRFDAFDFTELELQGMDKAYDKFIIKHPECNPASIPQKESDGCKECDSSPY